MSQKESESDRSIKEVADELWEFLPPNFCYKNRDRKTMYNWIRTRLENLIYDREKEIAEEVEKKRLLENLPSEYEIQGFLRAHQKTAVVAFNKALDEVLSILNE